MVKDEILRLIALHDGQWYWCQLARALLAQGVLPPIPLLNLVYELRDAGLIEVRSVTSLLPHRRYFLTAAGKQYCGRGPNEARQPDPARRRTRMPSVLTRPRRNEATLQAPSRQP